jgi:hypothetical protein
VATLEGFRFALTRNSLLDFGFMDALVFWIIVIICCCCCGRGSSENKGGGFPPLLIWWNKD